MTDETKDVALEEERAHTHKAVLTVYSNGSSNMISVKVNWEPKIDQEAVEELGYLPAAYGFVEDYLLPAIEEAYLEWEAGPLLHAESPSKWTN
jgi:hypothetical protein